MNFNELKELIKLIDQTDIQKCEIHFDGAVVNVDKRKKQFAPQSVRQEKPREAVAYTEHLDDEPFTIMPNEKEDIIIGNVVVSPIVGTFFASSAPDKEPFAPIGKKVKKGDVVCIIEAMKVMNEITSDFDGEVAEVFVNNEDLVDFGKPLFRIV